MRFPSAARERECKREEAAIARQYLGRVPWEMVAWGHLPSHEAQHSIIATEGSRLRWLSELVGHLSTIPLLLPCRIAWITHEQHHAHANDPNLGKGRT